MRSVSEPRRRVLVNFKNDSDSLNDVSLYGLKVSVASQSNDNINAGDLQLHR